MKINMKSKFFNLYNKLFQKMVLIISQTSKYILTNVEDSARINTYFKKNFPFSYKYLFYIKLCFLVTILLSFKHDFNVFVTLTSDIITEENSNNIFYISKFPVFCYLILILYDYILSIYIIYKANSPVQNVFYQVVKQTLKVTTSATVLGVGYAHAFVEPNEVSNFVHTKTPFGRGWDSEIGSGTLKLKSDQVAGALGRDDMNLAVNKHTKDKIITSDCLNKIINDPFFKEKLADKLTVPEKLNVGVSLGLPDIPFISKSPAINLEISDSKSESVTTFDDNLPSNSEDNQDQDNQNQDNQNQNQNNNQNNPPRNSPNFPRNRIQRRHTK
jgi:hypothetical protein